LGAPVDPHVGQNELALFRSAVTEVVEHLGPAILEGERLDWVEAVDLEWDLEGAVFCKSTSHPDGRNDEDRARWAEPDTPIELLYVAHPQRDDDEVPVAPAGYWYPRWDDDEYGFVFVPRLCVSATR
jgi:hypothetical protein